MLEQYVFIEAYKWEVYLFYEANSIHRNRIIGKLEYAGFNKNIIQEIISNLGNINSGFCYSDFNNQRSIIVINETSSRGEFINSFVHKINHLGSHIEEKFRIEPYSEEASYLIGDIAQMLYYNYMSTHLHSR